MQDLGIILVIILVIVLVVRGPKTLPQIGAMLGRGFREAKKEAKSVRGEPGGDDTPAS